MLWKDVQLMGEKPYGTKIVSYKGKEYKALLLGFDTEYDSTTRELLTVQLGYEDYGKTFIINKDFKVDEGGYLPVPELRKLINKFTKTPEVNQKIRHRSINLFCYWSIAELQHFALPSLLQVDENPFTYGARLFHDAHNSIYVSDLFPWYQGGLKKMAQMLLTKEHQKFDYDTTNITAENLDDPTFIDYAKQDAIICYAIANNLRNKFLNKFGVDITFTKTPARTSANAFRKLYILPDEIITQTNNTVRRQGLLSSWGGVSIAFRRGIYNDHFYYYDGKSMYPSTAINMKILPLTEDWFPVYEAEEYKKFEGLATCEFEFPSEVDFPSLPCVSIKPKKKMFYPLQGISTCTGSEISYALSQGAEIKIKHGWGYKTGDERLAKYLKEMMKGKNKAEKEDNSANRFIYKLMANSIIGKLSQNIQKTDINVILANLHTDETGTYYVGEMLYKAPLHLGSIYMPEWNSLILGKARATNSKVFENLDAYVGTTDSAITTQNLGEKFVEDKIIYKKEYEGESLGILRAKFYYLDDKHIAAHAMRAGTKYVQDFIKIGLHSPIIVYKAQQVKKMRSSIIARNISDFGKFETKQYVFNTSWDNKRKLLLNNVTKPYKDIKEMMKDDYKSLQNYSKLYKYIKKYNTEPELQKRIKILNYRTIQSYLK